MKITAEQHDFCASMNLDSVRIPKHVAIIMDGNGRWASERGQERVFGHMNGINSVRASVEAALRIGVRHLTLYAFSTENWSRPQEEVDALMDLLVSTLVKEVKDLESKGVRLRTIGDLTSLPVECQDQIAKSKESTKHLDSLDLILALSYSSKWELVEATKQLMKSGIDPDALEASHIDQYLATFGIPDPELMIRTSGEHRISNFMLWQLAYAEFHFTPVLWPDFGQDNFYEAVRDFQNRSRRFGGLLDTNHTMSKQG
ncbi:MAG: polyprenyl diphosphate synthase [Bacteroidetes bacterium]|jgi:undecaprenyl diphosphate synthase|nr:polyprenyl diphosphate synthase [Bacteroidota bacterium]|tara:strand:+ start:290 stop:1063 length:774 start_codon:yes stop_codon:yes gene_type:complete